MVKNCSGFCPVHKKTCTIQITYVDVSDLATKAFEKGTFDCQFIQVNDLCGSKCPIYQSAPMEIS